MNNNCGIGRLGKVKIQKKMKEFPQKPERFHP